MRRGRPGGAAALALLAFAAAGRAGAASLPARRACLAASHTAEAAAALPPGLLGAIGRVESGRYSARLGRVAPWPWTVDFAGTGMSFARRGDAIRAVRAAWAAGQRNIDVGCFQVNLGAHPHAFADLRSALDPATNAAYAAEFLVRLHARLGSWPAATAAYHSETAALGQPYLLAVMRSWTGAGGGAVVAPDLSWVVRTRVPGLHVIAPGSVVRATVGAMRIITPGGDAPAPG